MNQPHRPLIVVAELSNETNTYVHLKLDLEGFLFKRGKEILDATGDVSDLGGFLEAAQNYGWEVHPTVSLNGFPSGVVKDRVVDTFKKEFLAHLSEPLPRKPSAVLFLSHGAMVSESLFDVEGHILQWIRQHPFLQNVPIFGTLDPHGNFTQKMADHSACLLSYRENPHTDSRETSFRIAAIMDRYFKNQTATQTFYRHSRLLWPPTGTASSEDPVRILQTMARNFEKLHPEILAINIFSGFSFTDVPDAGLSFTVTAQKHEPWVEEILNALINKAWELKELGFPKEYSVSEAIEKISKIDGLGLLVEPSDNIGGGAIGDGIEVLKALLKSALRPAGIILQAQEAVATLYPLPLGSEKKVTLGRLYEGPESQVELCVKLISKSNGNFTLSDPHSHAASAGAEKSMGPTVIVEHQGITLMLTTIPSPPWDLVQWTSQGIDPRQFKVIGIKGAVAHRQTYDPISKSSFFVDTAGPSRSNLKKVIYKNIKRPIYPLDEIQR